MAENNANLNVIVKVRDEASATLNRLSNDVSDLGGSLNFASIGAGVLASGFAAIAGSAIVNSVKAFADAEVKMAKFDALLKTMPPSVQALRDVILDTADNALVKFGFDNEEAALSILQLINATGNAEMGLEAFQTAMDLARYKGISLDEATRALILAFSGNSKILRELGIELDDHVSKQTVLEAAQRKLNGQAAAYAGTLQGQVDILRQLGEEANETFGSIFKPLIENVTHALIGWVAQQGVLNGELKKFLDENINPIIIGLTIIAGVILLALVPAIVGLLALLGPVGTVFAALFAGLGVFILMKPLFDGLAKQVDEIIKTVMGDIKKFIEWAANEIEKKVDHIKSIVQGVLDFFNSVKNTISSGLSRVGGFVGGLIPKFAEGGIVTGPTLGLLGEAGPEAVIPLDRLRGGGGGTNITINLQGDFYTDDETAERFGDALARVLKNQLNLGGIRA